MERDEVTEQAERQAEQMQEELEHLRGGIDSARKDWKAKRADESVPGAVPDRQASEGATEPKSDEPESEPEPEERERR